MQHTTLDISVVICAYTEERWDDLQAAINSVQAQTVPAREIIVVIDHNDLLLSQAQRTFPELAVMPNREQRGVSGSRNTGITASQSAVVAFIDDDAVALPDWLAQLTAVYAVPQVMGVGGAIKPVWTTTRPAWFPTEFDWVVGCTYRGMPETTAPVRNLIGANFSVRREVFEAVGGFRQGFGRQGKHPVGCEETDLCIRAQQHWPERIFSYEPQAVVFHRVPDWRARWTYFKARCYAEGLSKARLGRQVGTADGLSSERHYTFRTLPTGVLHNLRAGLLHQDGDAWRRAGAIVAGLALTTWGYLIGSFAARGAGFDPTLVVPVPQAGLTALAVGASLRATAVGQDRSMEWRDAS